MQEFLFTAIAIIILFRLFRGSVFIYKNQHPYNNQYQQQQKREGEITIEETQKRKGNKNTKEDGEYVDYEEIK